MDPNNLTIERAGSGWALNDGPATLLRFDLLEFAEAQSAMQIIEFYDFTSLCFVGRPDASMIYWLVDGETPRGAFPGEDCVAFSPEDAEVVFDGQFRIVSQGSTLLSFGFSAPEAVEALEIIQLRGFNHQCFVGRPNASMEYYRSDPDPTPEVPNNLLVNPYFDTDLEGWGLEPAASPEWDPWDVDDSPQSGSARLVMVGDQTCCTQGILQYVRIVPGAEYDLSAWIYVVGAQGVGGSARIFGFWQQHWAPGACSGTVAGFGSGILSVGDGDAGQWVLRHGVVQAPPDAHCALVKGVISKSALTGEFVARIDDFAFAPEPLPSLAQLGACAALSLLGRCKARRSSLKPLR